MNFFPRNLSIMAAPFFWCASVWLLWMASPIFADNFGPTPSFYWGKNLTPAVHEYAHDRALRLRFRYPYWIGGAIMTFLGCGVSPGIANLLIRRWPTRPFLLSTVTCMSLLLFAAAASDMGTLTGLWRGPMMWPAPFVVMRVVLPLSLVAGLLHLAELQLVTYQNSTKTPVV
jgi:hypothetical protein